MTERPSYYPDFTEAVNHVPCSDNPDTDTHCCNEGDICLSNGYCLGIDTQPFGLLRGSCTNQAWDNGCSIKCLYDSDYQAGSNPISYLEPGNASQAFHCCGTLTASDNQTRCREGDPFTIQDAHIQLGYALLSDVQSVPSSSASPSPSSTNNSGTGHDAAIGAGVGAPLGVIALASKGWAFFERRRSQNAYAKMEAMAAMANSGVRSH